MRNDELHVVHARAAGLDVHKMEITATVRLCVDAGEPVCETRRFDALAGGLAALSAWLCAHRVEAAAMEATGVYWETPWDALTEAGIEVQLLHAQQVKQLRGRKTDIEDSRWLARVFERYAIAPASDPMLGTESKGRFGPPGANGSSGSLRPGLGPTSMSQPFAEPQHARGHRASTAWPLSDTDARNLRSASG